MSDISSNQNLTEFPNWVQLRYFDSKCGNNFQQHWTQVTAKI